VAGKQRMPVARRGCKLRMKLYAHEPGVVWQLHYLGEAFCWCPSADDHAGLFQAGHVDIVHFVTMAMTLVDFRSINRMCASTVFYRATLCAFAHRTAQVRGLI